MRVGRTLPPAAAPLSWLDFAGAIGGMIAPARTEARREDEFRRYFGARDVFLVSSGTAALAVVLRGLRSLSSRTRVVVPAYTCFSVPAAVLAAGLRPAICDVEPATLDFDHAMLAGMLDEDTLCVVGHHLFGIPSDIERLRAICRPRGIFVVEDAAQALGIAWNGRRLGTLGDAGVFSLGRGKQITSGTGGIIVANSDRVARVIAAECRALRRPSLLRALIELATTALMAILIRPRLYWLPAAMPFLRLGETVFPREVPLERLAGIKAGLLRHWRARLAESNRSRARNAAELCRRLNRLGREAVGGVTTHPCLRLPILADSPEQRLKLHELSQRRGLGLALAYPTPISEIPEMKPFVGGRSVPGARYLADHLLTLPTHRWLSDDDRRSIGDVVERMGGRDLTTSGSGARALRRRCSRAHAFGDIPHRSPRIFLSRSGGIPDGWP